MGWEILASHVLKNVLKEGRVLSVKDMELFTLLRDLLIGILSSNPRHCFDESHKCEFREGACHILFTKGDKWTAKDLEQCKYRKKVE